MEQNLPYHLRLRPNFLEQSVALDGHASLPLGLQQAAQLLGQGLSVLPLGTAHTRRQDANINDARLGVGRRLLEGFPVQPGWVGGASHVTAWPHP